MQCVWPKRAPTSSPWISSARSIRSMLIPERPKKTCPRPFVWSSRSTVVSMRCRPTSATAALEAALAEGIELFGRLDIVVANAGIFQAVPMLEMDDAGWQETIDINLTGVWNTARAALPHLIDGGRGGSIILISSIAGLKAQRNSVNYVAAKHGVVGIMRALSSELADHFIRVNSVHPTGVDTIMIKIRKSGASLHPTSRTRPPSRPQPRSPART